MNRSKTVRLPLTQGKFVIIDANDLRRVSAYKWHAQKISGTYYACADGPKYMYLHRFIVGASDRERCRLSNGDGLDCRAKNIVKKEIRFDNRKPYERKKVRKDKYEKVHTSDGIKVKIPLTHGFHALIDECDFPLVSQYSWAVKGKEGNRYAVATITCKDGVRRHEDVRMHNLIMRPSKKERVDHRNHDTFDNTRENLRKCSRFQNHQNRVKNKNSPYRYKGISFKRGGWESAIEFRGHYKYLGRYKTDTEAARVYDRAAKKYHGEFAALNFPGKE